MLNADWLGTPCTLRTIGARGIKTWRAFGAPSHFQLFIIPVLTTDESVIQQCWDFFMLF